jgi:hypothetical protein
LHITVTGERLLPSCSFGIDRHTENAFCYSMFRDFVRHRLDDERSAVDVLDSLLVKHRAPISFPGPNESTALPDLSRIVTHFAAKGRVGGGATPGFSCPVICDFVSPLLFSSRLSRLRLLLRIL